jgi:hypothetical protein
MATTDSVGSCAAIHLRRHESAGHERHGLGLPGFRTLFVSLPLRTFLSYLTETTLARFDAVSVCLCSYTTQPIGEHDALSQHQRTRRRE